MRQSHITASGVVSATEADDTESAIEKAMDILADGVRGYQTIADELESPTLRSLFLTLADERNHSAETLLRAATDSSIAFDANTEGTVPGAIHRTWLKLETMVAGDEAVVESVENAEEHAVSDLETILETDVADPVAAAIRHAILDVTNAKARLADWREQIVS